MTKKELEAYQSCKNRALQNGSYDCYVIRFDTHPYRFKDFRNGEEILLNSGYGLVRYWYEGGEKRYKKICCDNDKDGKLIPFNSYWEALASI